MTSPPPAGLAARARAAAHAACALDPGVHTHPGDPHRANHRRRLARTPPPSSASTRPG